MKPEQIETAFERLASVHPDPKTELNYDSPFQLLVAVVLSAQATDQGVNRATQGLFAAAPAVRDIAALGVEGLMPYIKTIGLYRNKARHVHALACQLLERHAGQLPRTREALQALPGVGRKTASVVLNVVFGEPTIAVDTHVFRVARRTAMATGKTPEQVERQLLECVPPRFRQHAHHWLILHGRYVCKARNPDCGNCVLRDLCAYPPAADTPKTRPSTA